jgi:hypothetical protein
VTGLVPEAFDKPPDFTLYERTPKFAAINAINKENLIFRNPNRVVSEIRDTITAFGIRNFVFFDDNLLFNKGEHLNKILEIIIKKNLRTRFWGLHGIDPCEITEEVVTKMRKAKFNAITLQCMFQKDGSIDFSCYREATRLITQQGYRERSSALSCQYYIGKPGEDLKQVVEDILELHHIVGTVIPVPFLPVPKTREFYKYEKLLDDIPLEKRNVNLFPFADSNGYSISDYFDLIRMTAMLNKKVRRKTFDYLGTHDVAHALRGSISRHEKRTTAEEVNQG